MALRFGPVSMTMFATLAFPLFGHDIPNDVTVQAWLKPDGKTLTALVRVPLKAVRDIEIPQRGPGYLDLKLAPVALRDAATIWIAGYIEVREGELALPKPQVVAVQASLESDRSFVSFESAVAHLQGPPLDPATNVPWNQVMLDAELQWPIAVDTSKFTIHSRWAHFGVRTLTTLRFDLPGDSGRGPVSRAMEWEGDPGWVALDPGWTEAASQFVKLGVRHILEGTDHLLFLLCLVIPFRRLRALIGIVTAFTVAHSITLIASAFGLGPDTLWFPPLVETLIATSIVYMALENILGVRSVERRWLVTFLFGLVHGFGFSFALRQTLQFAGSHLVVSLLSFNLGVEIGQLLALAVALPILGWFLARAVEERPGTIVLSALVAHTAWHWMIDRGEALGKFGMPTLDAGGLAILLRWAMLPVAAYGGYALLRRRPD